MVRTVFSGSLDPGLSSCTVYAGLLAKLCSRTNREGTCSLRQDWMIPARKITSPDPKHPSFDENRRKTRNGPLRAERAGASSLMETGERHSAFACFCQVGS